MSIWDRLKKELIDIVEFLDDSNDTLCFRFERFQNEIKNGAKCIVREGQVAVFVREGQLADVLPPGTHTLDTRNLPILSTLLGWKYGFESPFKAEIYFVSTRMFTNLKWGTMNPVMLRDPEFGPVRLRAFGTYAIRINNAGTFVKNVVGTDSRFTTDEVTGQLRNLIVSNLTEALGEAKIPMLDLAGNYSELGGKIAKVMQPEFDKLGIELATMLVENVSLPPEVEAALDKRTSMGVIGDLNSYTKFQTAEAIRDAAKNPGAVGTFMGMGMGQMFAGQMVGQNASTSATIGGGPGTPPPLQQSSPLFVAVNGQQTGPFESGLVASKIRSGEIQPSSLVWRQGMAGWVQAKDVPELAGLFVAPPPVPGGPGTPPALR
jgi:membrane protease subunit (stomatin/prohibitin family)